MGRFRKEPITVYEKKINNSVGVPLSANGTLKDLTHNYQKYVENLIKNAKDTSGNPIISDDEVDRLRSE